MADSDNELAEEVRQFTGNTDTSSISDTDLQQLITIGKQEIRTRIDDTGFTFYQNSPSTHDAERALFWFTCIGLKVRLGELGNITLTVDGLEAARPSDETYRFWLHLFNRHMAATETKFSDSSGAATKNISRDDRSYEFDVP